MILPFAPAVVTALGAFCLRSPDVVTRARVRPQAAHGILMNLTCHDLQAELTKVHQAARDLELLLGAEQILEFSHCFASQQDVPQEHATAVLAHRCLHGVSGEKQPRCRVRPHLRFHAARKYSSLWP